MSSETAILWGLLFGSFGIGFFIFGKRQRRVVPLFTGIGLMVFPYFVPNVWVLMLVGILLLSLPYFLRY